MDISIENRGSRKLLSVLIAIRRAIVLCTGTIALYIILGTFTDRLWWYGFFWDGQDRLAYMMGGVRWLIDQAFWLTLSILIALAIAVGVGRYFRRHVWKVLDSVPWIIVMFACLAVATDALVLRHTMATTYAAQSSSLLVLQQLSHTIHELVAPPKVQPPIYFHYLDSSRVESLYNQLEPELEIKEREVTGKSTQTAQATAGVGDTKIGVQVGSENGSKSIYGCVASFEVAGW